MKEHTAVKPAIKRKVKSTVIRHSDEDMPTQTTVVLKFKADSDEQACRIHKKLRQVAQEESESEVSSTFSSSS